MAKNIIKHRYLEAFGVTIIVLALVRCAFPGVSASHYAETAQTIETAQAIETDQAIEENAVEELTDASMTESSCRFLQEGERPHRIFSVPSYKEAFPDTNALQLSAAQRWGVSPVADRQDAEARKRELVYIGHNPYYHVDKLHASIPYLVPRAAVPSFFL